MKTHEIKLYFYGSNQLVPIEYQNMVLKFLHTNILGQNNSYHDSISLYSVSQLYNSKKTNCEDMLLFNKGAILLIRTPSIEIFKDFYLKSKNAIGNELGYGLVLKSVDYTIEDFKNINSIVTGASPIYLGQNKNSEERDHITYLHGNEICSPLLKQTIITKAKLLNYNININDFNIEFDLSQPIKTKLIKIGDVSNIATLGKVKITGDPNIIGICYNVGLGLSTGCGFGFIFNLK